MTSSPSHPLTLSLSHGWEAWKRLARRIAEFQSRVLLMLLYVVLLMPVGLCLRLMADPLRRRTPEQSNWTPRAETAATLEEARRQ